MGWRGRPPHTLSQSLRLKVAEPHDAMTSVERISAPRANSNAQSARHFDKRTLEQMPKVGRPNLIKRVLSSDALRDETAPHEAVDKVERECNDYRWAAPDR